MTEQQNAMGWHRAKRFMCDSCAHYKSDTVTRVLFNRKFVTEENLRCTLGGFPTFKTFTCFKHSRLPINEVKS